jgi:hypothetical protein
MVVSFLAYYFLKVPWYIYIIFKEVTITVLRQDP